MRIGSTKYFIESDSLQITLLERYKAKDKEGYGFRKIGYFTTFEGLMRKLLDLNIKETGLEDLKSVLKAIDEVKAIINNLQLEITKNDMDMFKTDDDGQTASHFPKSLKVKVVD